MLTMDVEKRFQIFGSWQRLHFSKNIRAAFVSFAVSYDVLILVPILDHIIINQPVIFRVFSKVTECQFLMISAFVFDRFEFSRICFYGLPVTVATVPTKCVLNFTDLTFLRKIFSQIFGNFCQNATRSLLPTKKSQTPMTGTMQSANYQERGPQSQI